MIPRTLDEILEQWKQFGLYELTVYYGRDVGCDDSDDPQEERPIKLTGCPVGCIGEARVLWSGTLAGLRTFDPRTERPEVQSNPPPHDITQKAGFFIWGARPESVQNALEFLYRERKP